MEKPLVGKVALVTGAGSGIGRASAQALAGAGASVILLGRRKANIREAASEIESAEGRAIYAPCDVTERAQVAEAVKLGLHTFGHIDILVNSAGINTKRRGVLDIALEDWDRVVEINMKGSFMCAQEEGKVMIKQEYGKIVFTSSISGNIINKPQYQISMSVSKAGIQHLTRCLAAEWAQYGIRVNCISPGYIYTTALDAPDLKPNIPMWTELTPVGRLGKVEDLQGAVVFLSSDVSDFMTGQNLKIDGGYTLM